MQIASLGLKPLKKKFGSWSVFGPTVVYIFQCIIVSILKCLHNTFFFEDISVI